MQSKNKAEVLYFKKVGSVANIKSKIEDYFTKTFQSNNKSDQYSGAFISEYEFEIRPKLEMILAKRNSKPALITGRITQIDEKWTEMIITRQIKNKFSPYKLILFLASIVLVIVSFQDIKYKFLYMFFGLFSVLILFILITFQNTALKSAVSDFAIELQLLKQ